MKKQIAGGGLVLLTSMLLFPTELKALSLQDVVPKVSVNRTEQRVVHQESWQARWSKNNLTIKQNLAMVSNKERNQALTYRIVSQQGEILQEKVASITPVSTNRVQSEVTFDLSEFKNEHYLYLELSYKGAVQKIKHQQPKSTVFSKGSVFQLVTKGEDLILVNQSRQYFTYESHQFFAEQLHLTLKESVEIETYQLRRIGDSSESGTIGLTLDQGIDLRFIESGSYYIYLNQRPIHVNSEMPAEDLAWYTVTREGISKKIQLTIEAGMLMLKVENVLNLPEDVYDILIDPGHGGTDPGAIGNGATEAEEVLKVSHYIKERLEAHGLKVKMTRQGMENPSIDKSCKYDVCPYLESGRVSQVYETQAKYVISNHLNASESGQSKGSEVYSSVRTTDEWSTRVIKAFQSEGRLISDVLLSSSRVSTGSYKRGFENVSLDYYYMIRESGGSLTDSTSIKKFNPSYQTTPN